MGGSLLAVNEKVERYISWWGYSGLVRVNDASFVGVRGDRRLHVGRVGERNFPELSKGRANES